MNFQEFKNELEDKLKGKISFELLEFIYQPYVFGSGIIAYRIKGYNYMIIYDGRDNKLQIKRSKPHTEYARGREWLEILAVDGLNVEIISGALIDV